MTDIVSLLFIATIPIDFKITNFSLHLFVYFFVTITVGVIKKCTFRLVKMIVMLHNYGRNKTNLHSCHFIVFTYLSTSFYCCYMPHRTWFKRLASLCRSIKLSFCRLPSRKNIVTIQNYEITKCTLFMTPTV